MKTMIAAGLVLASVGAASTVMADDKVMPDDAESRRQVAEAYTDVLGHFELDDGVEITFSAEYETADRVGDPVLSITAVGPGDAFPYLAHFSNLAATSLEAFLAVAPEGTEVPDAILDAHEREAVSLARSTALHELELDQGFSAATYNSSSCDSWIAFLNSISGWIGETSSLSFGNHNRTRAGTGGNILASMCNYDNPDPLVIDLKYAQFCSVNVFNFLICENEIFVPDGHRVDRVWLGATTTRMVRAIPLGGFPNTLSFIGIGGFAPI